MGGLTGAVHWWEESQLRVLVLTSLLIQFFLFFFALLRRQAIPDWFRFIMWLAYHGGDAVAIYALATLFNRRKYKCDGDGGGGNTLLEVVWAPVLLIHLAGQDGVTAYNIEDNELSSRHLLTAVAQVTVVVYIFVKSWPPGGDKMLLASAILLFFVGFVKCLLKAWAFKRASINSLVSSGGKKKNDGNMDNTITLEEYVKHAKVIVDRRRQPEDHQVVEEGEAPRELGAIKKRARACLNRLLPSTPEGEGSSKHHRSRQIRRERAQERKLRRQEKKRLLEAVGEAPNNLFVDLSSSYTRRISILKQFWGLSEEGAYDSVQGGLASAFCLLYTKLKTSGPDNSYKNTEHESGISKGQFIRGCIHFIRIYLPWAPIALFHHSHREAYSSIDVKVTYALLCCTAVLEFISMGILLFSTDDSHGWPETVAQYSLAGYFVRNKKHRIEMSIVSLFECKDSIDRLWCMDPCSSSFWITSLVLRYLKDGWDKNIIKDAASYRNFNNHSSRLNMNRPFDECVLLWHLATDFCFFDTRSTSSSFPDHKCDFAEPPTRETLTRLVYRAMVQGKGTSVAHKTTSTTSTPPCSEKSAQCKAVQCRQMSNYMVYLLFVNPEMLLPGSRRNLFKTAYGQLKDILNLKEWLWNPVCWSRCTPCGVELIKEEAIVMEKLIEVMKKPDKRASKEESSKEVIVTVTKDKSKRSSQEGSSMKGSNKEDNFIDQAWDLAQKLLDEKDEMKRWKHIQDVWVQMLCFSASRCRGYLHAKALGKGGEFLSYVWLLLFYMGMETFSERLQRELLPKDFTGAGTPPASEVQTRAGASTTPTTSEICIAEDNMGS